MKVKLQGQTYNTLLLPIEWRYAASVVGLIRYFEYVEETEGMKLYEITKKRDRDQYVIYSEIGGYVQGLLYNEEDITEERYLQFVEHYYGENLQHIVIERKLSDPNREYTEDEISVINSYISGTNSNTILKKIFGKTKFTGNNAEEILHQIDENRFEIIRETYRNKTSMYRKYANIKKLFTPENPHCRLLGYDLDENRKSKSVAYQFDTSTFVANDEPEFDFIPFAFTYSPEAVFINNNNTITDLLKTNDAAREIFEQKQEIVDNKVKRDGMQTKLIKTLIYAEDFMQHDTEVIVRKQESECFETLFVRREALQRLRNVYDKYNLEYTHKYGYNYWLNVEESVINCCINEVYLDGILDQLLVLSREDSYAGVIIWNLVRINVEWKGVEGMTEQVERARKAGYAIGRQIRDAKNGENKAKSYKNKLINAIVSHDRDRVLEIMLQLSGYIGGEIGTIYDILDSGEEWSDIAISFTNSLVEKRDDK